MTWKGGGWQPPRRPAIAETGNRGGGSGGNVGTGDGGVLSDMETVHVVER
jgi:hypothetical protein